MIDYLNKPRTAIGAIARIMIAFGILCAYTTAALFAMPYLNAFWLSFSIAVIVVIYITAFHYMAVVVLNYHDYTDCWERKSAK